MFTALVAGALISASAPVAPGSSRIEAANTFVVATKPKGLDLRQDADIKTTKSERTGHAAYSAGQLKAELAKLKGAQLAAYKAVHAKIASFPESAQLDALVVKHRVGTKDSHGHSVIEDLATIAGHNCEFGLDNVQVVRDTISDITRPSTIYQSAHGTCTATSVSSALARSQPGEYVRIVEELATGGHASVKNGSDALKIKDFIPFKDRATTGNLLQPAIMELEASVSKGHYVNKEDKIHYPDGSASTGAPDKGVSLAETEILGGKYETLFTGRYDYSKDKSKKAMYTEYLGKAMKILSHASAENPVLVSTGMDHGKGQAEGGHEMQCVACNATTMKIRNPWGEVHEIPTSTVKASLNAVNYRVSK